MNVAQLFAIQEMSPPPPQLSAVCVEYKLYILYIVTVCVYGLHGYVKSELYF